ncbi:MAG: hypothetical protein JWM14_164 [Chitinophagaceae bacterium]|nr:hypothetical protein [Chitinophagaceae bacterium]
MRLKQLFISVLLISLVFSCVKRSATDIRIREGKRHQSNNDCPELDCGHTGKKK